VHEHCSKRARTRGKGDEEETIHPESQGETGRVHRTIGRLRSSRMRPTTSAGACSDPPGTPKKVSPAGSRRDGNADGSELARSVESLVYVHHRVLLPTVQSNSCTAGMFFRGTRSTTILLALKVETHLSWFKANQKQPAVALKLNRLSCFVGTSLINVHPA